MNTKQQEGFDLIVTHRDPKSGAVVSSNPYVMTVIQSGEGRLRLFERPPGSGNLFDKKNQPVGRWEKDDKGVKTYNKDAAHVVYLKPETQDQKLAREVMEKSLEIEALKKQLAAKEVKAIQAESKSEDITEAKKTKTKEKDGGGKKA